MCIYKRRLMYHDIKGRLAKLLATENLVVEHKNCETAQFNVETRVLTLPIWKISSNDVYDALVAHEVGHALYTPMQEWFLEPEYQSYLILSSILLRMFVLRN